MIDITPQITISDLLKAYPELEDKLIEIAPVFIKLKNPVLRKTIAKITSLNQASIIGNIQVAELVNKLRSEVGQENLITNASSQNGSTEKIPEDILKRIPVSIYDAREDLNNGVHPLPKVMKDVSKLQVAEVYKLITAFVPAPLIAKIKEKGYSAWTNTCGGVIETYIVKIRSGDFLEDI